MIKKLGRYVLSKFHFLIPESILIRYAKGVLDKKDTSFTTSVVRNYFNERYKNATPEKKKRLGLLVWRSEAAVQYFKDRTFPETIVAQFLAIIEQNSNFNVCEIGTGNGRLLEILAERSPNHNFNGVDLSEEQIEINKNTYAKNPKIRFTCADILEQVKSDPDDATIYISFVSLTTFTPEMVSRLFECIAARTSPSILAIYEPVESNPADGERSIIRGGLAYAHNYITIAKQNGFTVEEESFHLPFAWLVFKKIINKK